MNLLFTDNTGNTELKELLGFLDLDLKFSHIKSFITRATDTIIELVGQEVYDIAVAEYAKASSDATKNNDIIFNIRFPVALLAYIKFAPHNDVSHTNRGRLNRIEDNEKTAFQWMIEADNNALERAYYEALDGLIKYLDTNIDPWKGTDAYKQINNLFITTTKEFEDYFYIGNSRLLLLKLAPGIRLAENTEIKSRIGVDLFNSMKATLKDPKTPPTITIDQDLLSKIKEACVYLALSWGMRHLSVQLFPDGVVQNFLSGQNSIKSSQPAPKDQTIMAAQFFKQDAELVLKDIEDLINTTNNPLLPIPDPLTFMANEADKFLNT